MNAQATWYFDFISPFAYLQWQKLNTINDLSLTVRPILFAGLLEAYGTKGPVEIPAKRLFSYRHVIWRAEKAGITLTLPPTHPFNPLPALRLCVALGATRQAVDTVFDHIWCRGQAADTPAGLDVLAKRLGIENVEAALCHPQVKSELQANFSHALQDGVFGVPSICIGSHLFWGDDATDMFSDYLRDPQLFNSPSMLRASTLPVGQMRKSVSADPMTSKCNSRAAL
jgi:2-hydroxychromene-2-carboxylate isomerase